MSINDQKQDNIEVLFAIGSRARSNRTRPVTESWESFIKRMRDYAEYEDDDELLTGNESEKAYKAYKSKLHYISAQFVGDRARDNVDCRSLLFIDMDGVSADTMKHAKRAVAASGFAALYHTTTGHRHAVKGADTHSGRFLLPTDRVMDADAIEHVQAALLEHLGLAGVEGVDVTAGEAARIMFVPAPGAMFREYAGKAVPVRYMRRTYDAPAVRKPTATSQTDTDALSGWAFEKGLEPLSSGRGWAIQCPNSAAHTDGNDGTAGDTAIMKPGAGNPEVRFKCQHAHCQELNSHQHMMLRLCGVPDAHLPDAHNISAAKVAELLPEVDAEAVSEAECAAAGVTDCNDDDLADEVLGEIAAKSPTNPAGSLIIDGFIRAGATGLILGESGTGKTTFAGYLSFCIATGASLFGRRKNRVKRGKVVVLGWEGSGEVKEAFDANAKRYLSEEAQAKANDNFEYIDMQTMEVDGQPFDILNIGHQNYLLNMLKGEATAFICDTYMAMTGGKGEENSNSDAAKYMGAINRIAKQAGTVAFVIHHTKKGSLSPRGATALEGAADMCVTLQCPNEQNKSHMNFYVYKVRMAGGVMMKWMYGIKSTPVRIVSKEAIEELAAAEDLWFADSIELDAVVENPDYEFRSGDRAYGFSYDLYLGEAWVPEKAAGDVVFADSIDEQEATFLMRVKSSPNGVKAEEGRRIYGVEQQRQLAARVKPLVEDGVIIAVKGGREVIYKFAGTVTLPTLKESHKAILSLFSNHCGALSDAEIAKATGIKSVRRGYLLASLVAARMLAEVEDGYIEGNQYPDEDLA